MNITQKLFVFIILSLLFVILGAMLYYVFVYNIQLEYNKLNIGAFKVTWLAPSSKDCLVRRDDNVVANLPICWSKKEIVVIDGDIPINDAYTITLPKGSYTITAVSGINASRDLVDVFLYDVISNERIVTIMSKGETRQWANYTKQGPINFQLSSDTSLMGKYSNDAYTNNSVLSMIIIKEKDI